MTDGTHPAAAFRAAIDAAHAEDPRREDGRAAEAVYVERVESWVRRLEPSPSLALELAARCQHLERWSVPREGFPLGRAGYHRWRVAVQQRQGERARALLLDAGCDAELAARVAALAAKATVRGDSEAQVLEDAACLAFLTHELEPFAAGHPGYTPEKYLEILRKTWRKMSPAGRALALGVELPPAIAGMLHQIAGSDPA
jgi:hypothetical protein